MLPIRKKDSIMALNNWVLQIRAALNQALTDHINLTQGNAFQLY
tara:strand:- start:927 stop:1058 length:132 start_codon:yes stop_codon:yes gene_type:complete